MGMFWCSVSLLKIDLEHLFISLQFFGRRRNGWMYDVQGLNVIQLRSLIVTKVQVRPKFMEMDVKP
jgi:hypothetical protein